MPKTVSANKKLFSPSNRYIVLLRGINISGKNKISMKELQQEMEKSFANVVTLLNSGNVIFDSQENDTNVISQKVTRLIETRFGLSIPVCVLTPASLDDILQHTPVWWGTNDEMIYHNLIFMIPPITVAQVRAALGEPSASLEKVQSYGEAIFWSFDLKNYRRARWWQQTAMSPIRDQITIRTANTMRKINSKCHAN